MIRHEQILTIRIKIRRERGEREGREGERERENPILLIMCFVKV